MRKLLSLIAMLLVSVTMLMAQNKTITGHVISAEDGEPVIGATVIIPGTNTGTVTDIDGKFSLSVPAGTKELTFSYVGLTSKTVAAKDKMSVTLESDDKVLEDVVVTAMGIKRSSKALGYSAIQVKAEDLTEVRSSDVISGLAGKMAGVQVNAATAPGASNSVVIRGFSSLGGNNQPLYIVDGVPLNNSASYSNDGLNAGYDFGNGANAVNPDDVASMTVLKGAAATALYGSRAANGIVMITTKSGSKQTKGIGVTYNGGLQWENILRAPQLQNRFGMGWYGDKTDDENGSWGPAFDGSILKYGSIYNNSQLIKSYVPMKNNIRDFFDNGFMYSNSVSLDGASNDGNTTFFTSFSQISEDGIVPSNSDSYRKYTFSTRASHKVKDLTVSASLNYAYNKNNFVNTGQKESSMYNAVMQTPRDISIAEYKDLSDPFHTPGYYYTPYGITNPYWVVENYKNQMEGERFYGKFQLDYDFLKYFRATYRFGYDQSTNHREAGSPNLAALFGDTYLGQNGASTFEGVTGSVSQQTTRRREINQDFMVTYDQQFQDDYRVNAIVGFNGNERQVSYLYGAVSNLTIPTWYNLGNSAEIPTVEQYLSKRRLYGVYAQAEFAWKEMLFVTATARNDWSSTLPQGQNSFFYPGITASWVFTELLSDNLKDIISFGKARLAWGKTGNDADPYMTRSVYVQGSASSSGWGSSAFPFQKVGVNAYSKGNTLGSENLSPEMTTEIEAGLNVAFLNNRINIDASYYDRTTDKQIMTLSMDPASGYSAMNTNLGEINNHGVELLVNLVPVRTKDLEWSLSLNWTKNWNKVVDLPDELGGEYNIYGLSGGTGMYAIEGREIGVFKAYTSQKDENGNIIVDNQGLPLITDDLVEIGSCNNKYQMGFGTKLSWKGISFAADFDFRYGGLMYSRTADILYFTGNAIQTAYNDRNPYIVPNSVTVDGEENTVALDPTNIYNYWNNGGDQMDANFLVDKTYLKLRTVSLGWQLPRTWLAKTFLTDVKLSVFGNNLWMWTPESNTFIDPELTSFGNDLQGQYGEWSANPSCRRFGFNLSVKF